MTFYCDSIYYQVTHKNCTPLLNNVQSPHRKLRVSSPYTSKTKTSKAIFEGSAVLQNRIISEDFNINKIHPHIIRTFKYVLSMHQLCSLKLP
jgi:hypothetical protein